MLQYLHSTDRNLDSALDQQRQPGPALRTCNALATAERPPRQKATTNDDNDLRVADAPTRAPAQVPRRLARLKFLTDRARHHDVCGVCRPAHSFLRRYTRINEGPTSRLLVHWNVRRWKWSGAILKYIHLVGAHGTALEGQSTQRRENSLLASRVSYNA